MSSHYDVKRLTSDVNESEAKGPKFAEKVANYFSRQGWKIQQRKKIRGREIDLYGEDMLGWNSYLLVDCKEEALVTSGDVMIFMNIIQDFEQLLRENSQEPSITAIIAHKGTVPQDAKAVAQTFSPTIKFKKFTEQPTNR